MFDAAEGSKEVGAVEASFASKSQSHIRKRVDIVVTDRLVYPNKLPAWPYFDGMYLDVKEISMSRRRSAGVDLLSPSVLAVPGLWMTPLSSK